MPNFVAIFPDICRRQSMYLLITIFVILIMFFRFVALVRVFLFLLSQTKMNGFVKIQLLIVQIDRLSPKPRLDTIIFFFIRDNTVYRRYSITI